MAMPTSSVHLTENHDRGSSLHARSPSSIPDLMRHSKINDGSVIRGGHESYKPSVYRLSSSEPEAKSASVRSGPGILIFSRSRQLLHMNRRALELTGHLNQAEMGPANDIRLALVRDLNAQIHEAVDSRKETNISEILELKRVIFDAGRKILVRGFWLAGRHSHDDSRIVIVLDEIDLPQEHLTKRRHSASLLRAVPPSSGNQQDGDPKDRVSDTCT